MDECLDETFPLTAFTKTDFLFPLNWTRIAMVVDTFCSQLREIFNASWISGVQKFDSFFPLNAQRSKKSAFYLLFMFSSFGAEHFTSTFSHIIPYDFSNFHFKCWDFLDMINSFAITIPRKLLINDNELVLDKEKNSNL